MPLTVGSGPWLQAPPRPLGPTSGPVPLRTAPPLRQKEALGRGREGRGALAAPRLPSPITAGPYSLLQPNDDSPVKLNTAAILREGALYQRQVERELQRWGGSSLASPPLRECKRGRRLAAAVLQRRLWVGGTQAGQCQGHSCIVGRQSALTEGDGLGRRRLSRSLAHPKPPEGSPSPGIPF